MPAPLVKEVKGTSMDTTDLPEDEIKVRSADKRDLLNSTQEGDDEEGGDYSVSEAAENIASAELYAEDKEKEAKEAEAKAKEAEKKRLALSEKAESREQEKRNSKEEFEKINREAEAKEKAAADAEKKRIEAEAKRVKAEEEVKRQEAEKEKREIEKKKQAAKAQADKDEKQAAAAAKKAKDDEAKKKKADEDAAKKKEAAAQKAQSKEASEKEKAEKKAAADKKKAEEKAAKEKAKEEKFKQENSEEAQKKKAEDAKKKEEADKKKAAAAQAKKKEQEAEQAKKAKEKQASNAKKAKEKEAAQAKRDKEKEASKKEHKKKEEQKLAAWKKKQEEQKKKKETKKETKTQRTTQRKASKAEANEDAYVYDEELGRKVKKINDRVKVEDTCYKSAGSVACCRYGFITMFLVLPVLYVTLMIIEYKGHGWDRIVARSAGHAYGSATHSFLDTTGLVVDADGNISMPKDLKDSKSEDSKPEPKPEPKDEPKDEPKAEPAPAPKPEPKPELKDEPKAEPVPAPQPAPKPEPKDEPKPESAPAPQPAPKPEPKDEPKAEPAPAPKPAPKPEPKDEPKAEPAPAPKPAPKPEPKEEPKAKPAPAPKSDPKAEPAPAPKPAPKPEPEAKDEAKTEATAAPKGKDAAKRRMLLEEGDEIPEENSEEEPSRNRQQAIEFIKTNPLFYLLPTIGLFFGLFSNMVPGGFGLVLMPLFQELGISHHSQGTMALTCLLTFVTNGVLGFTTWCCRDVRLFICRGLWLLTPCIGIGYMVGMTHHLSLKDIFMDIYDGTEDPEVKKDWEEMKIGMLHTYIRLGLGCFMVFMSVWVFIGVCIGGVNRYCCPSFTGGTTPGGKSFCQWIIVIFCCINTGWMFVATIGCGSGIMSFFLLSVFLGVETKRALPTAIVISGWVSALPATRCILFADVMPYVTLLMMFPGLWLGSVLAPWFSKCGGPMCDLFLYFLVLIGVGTTTILFAALGVNGDYEDVDIDISSPFQIGFVNSAYESTTGSKIASMNKA